MIKFGFRYSLRYPGLFVLSLAIRRIISLILKIFYSKSMSFLNIFCIYAVQIIMCSIFLLVQNRRIKSTVKPQFLGITLIENTVVLHRPDSNFKIIVLLIFSAFFEIIGALVRRLASNSVLNYDELYAKYRSFEIIISSILCYLTLKTQIYRHHRFALIIMLIYLIIVILIEIIMGDNYNQLLITLSSSVLRVYLDTIEKYLFNCDFIDLNKMMIFEGIISIIISIMTFGFDITQLEISNLVSAYNDEKTPFTLVMFLLFLYCIATLFKNIYRRETIKEFTPMTRILAQSILDPYFIINGRHNFGSDTSFALILFFSFVMIFCSCVYNEVFVLYCFGLEKNTHLEIAKNTDRLMLEENNTLDSNILEEKDS